MGKDVLVVTTNEVTGFEIEEVHGYISVNFVSGADFLRDFFAGFSDFFGGISKSYTEEIDYLKDEAKRTLEKKAKRLKMNCILGLKIDLDPIFGDGKSMFMVSATGTAVRLKGYNTDKGVDNAREIEIKEALKDVYIQTKDIELKYDFTKISRFELEDRLEEYSQNQFKTLLDNMINTFDKEYAVATISDNKKKLDVIFDFIVNNKMQWVSDYMHKDISKGKVLIIRDMGIIDYNKVLELLKETTDKKTVGLIFAMFMSKPSFVNENQFRDLSELISYLDEKYSDNVETKITGAFKKKEVWVCKKCGTNIDADIKACHVCEIDKRGLPASIDATKKIEHLRSIRNALNRFYGDENTNITVNLK